MAANVDASLLQACQQDETLFCLVLLFFRWWEGEGGGSCASCLTAALNPVVNWGGRGWRQLCFPFDSCLKSCGELGQQRVEAAVFTI